LVVLENCLAGIDEKEKIEEDLKLDKEIERNINRAKL
jgi:hypothetical protein